MATNLTASELERYWRDGYLFPKRALSAALANEYREAWENHEAATGGPINGKYRYKAHLVFPFVDRLMREPVILDMVEAILGPDIMVWNTNLYPKEAHDKRFISWHQDAAHWGLDNNRIVTVWVALAAAHRRNGGMTMLPGSHANGVVDHEDTWDPDNILTRGQTIASDIDEGEAVWVELKPGECSLHHVEIMHSSPGNESDDRRVALAIRYITPSARQSHHDIDYATLLRGEDRYGHFRSERQPKANLEPEAVSFHAMVAESQGKILLHGTGRANSAGLAETNSFASA